jgi:hypothetical protein
MFSDTSETSPICSLWTISSKANVDVQFHREMLLNHGKPNVTGATNVAWMIASTLSRDAVGDSDCASVARDD